MREKLLSALIIGVCLLLIGQQTYAQLEPTRVIITPSSGALPATLADNEANGPMGRVAAYLMCWDLTNWDRCAPSDGGVGASTSSTNRMVTAYQTPFNSIDLDESEEAVKATAGEVCTVWVTNTATTTRWLKFYDATLAGTTVGTTTPLITIGVSGNADDDVSGAFATSNGCLNFPTAISVAATTSAAPTDTVGPTGTDSDRIVVMIGYR